MSTERTNVFGYNVPDTLFHLTNEESLQQILAEGLKPSIGVNSEICSERENRIYLTDKDSIPYWCVLLDIKNPILLEVHNADVEKFQYSCYSEYVCSDTIPSEDITIADQSLLMFDRKEYMQSVCKEYIITLSLICLWIVKAYTYGRVDDLAFEEISALLNVVDRLDYSCAPLSDWKEFVQEYGASGEYTFCDHYSYKQRGGPKLFEQIVLFPADEYLPVRQRVSDIITKLFPGCEEWETGGWTG